MLRIGAVMMAMSVMGMAAADVVYVSTTGSDANSGTAAKPFATPGRAVAEARKRGAAGVKIVVREGTYYLDAPIVLGPEDSGLSIEAAPGEKVVLSGGRAINGWKPWKGEILQADLSRAGLPDLSFREMYLGGKRQPMARVPNFDPRHPRQGGWMLNGDAVEAGSTSKLRWRVGDLHPEKWTHVERALVVFHDSLNYENTWAPIKAIDPAARTIEAGRGVYELKPGNPYFVCGVLEELDAPGEWYVDPEAKTLYFWPPAPLKKGEVVLPALESVVEIKGDNIRLAGLTISDCRGKAVDLAGARKCSVTACDIHNVGVGVYLGDDTHDCRVEACDITQTLGDGVSVWGSSLDHTRVSGHVIDNNYIHDYGWGQIHNRCGGVWMVRCSGCRVTHNRVHDGPRYAIGMDVGNDCEIAWNDCHHVNLETMDTGIVEAATAMDWGRPDETERDAKYNRGNSIHHNLLHDSGGWGTGPDGKLTFAQFSWGIYLDTHCSGWAVHDNIIYNTVLGAFMVNGGQDNVFDNNICADGKQHQIFLEPWPKYAMSGNRVEGNIFAYGGGGADVYSLGGYAEGQMKFARNLIWAGGEAPRISGPSGLRKGVGDRWKAWQAMGQDVGSVVADPGFVDAAKHDYRLRPESAMAQIAFRPIDLTGVGVYATALRKGWPRAEVTPVREPADYRPIAPAEDQPKLRDYEDYAVGESERRADVGEEAGFCTVRVTDETAAAGKHSLKLTVGPGRQHTFTPYVTYHLPTESGFVHAGFDLRWEKGADFVWEWRDDPQVYSLGPRIEVDEEGWLTVKGERMARLEAGKWARVDMTCGLGKDGDGTWELKVGDSTWQGLKCDGGFKTLDCVVMMLVKDGPGKVYVDGVGFERKK